MNLDIDNADIEKSFDRIAKDILLNKSLYMNDIEFRFTEIEFYYIHKDNHPDNYTHQLKRDKGEWRFHNQGFDITFDGNNDISDGGILIRGISIKDEYVNGPIKVLKKYLNVLEKLLKVTV